MTSRTLTSLLCVSLAISVAHAQVIPIKTMPFADGDQYAFLPSANLGMAGVSVAIMDTLLDPFVNPATGSRLQHGHVFGSPSFYSFSQKAGSGRTFPVGSLFRIGSTFGGVAVAMQELNPGTPSSGVNGPVFALDARAFAANSTFVTSQTAVAPPAPSSYNNRYASAIVGRVLPTYGVSLGGSVLWSKLSGVDGVDQLYTSTQSVIQSVDALDFRLGVLKEWQSRASLEALLVSSRFDARHDVNYVDLFWDPGTRSVQTRPRLQQNQDLTRTLGLQLKYQRALSDSGWRIGGLLTANRVSQPSAASYDVFTVRNDPGGAAAFDVGVGVAKAHGPMTFGVDAIYEPIWKHTKSDQSENRFRFSNAILRAGISQDFALSVSQSIRLQIGTQLRSIHYWVDEYDALQAPRFDVQQQWKEWGNTFGASMRFSDMEIHYRLRATSGAGRPVSSPFFPPGALRPLDVAGPIGSAPVTLVGVRATTQQFSVSVPIR